VDEITRDRQGEIEGMSTGIDTKESSMITKEIIDRIFKDPGTKYELTEFENLGKPIHEILSIYPKTAATGRDAGKTKYYLKSFIPFSSGNEEVQVLVEAGKASPEEIVRQLWVYKLINQYGYKEDEIDLEASVQFGTEVGTKAADIIVYTDNTKETPKIIVECKKPKRKDGIEQLKSYMNTKGAPVAVWSNGSDSIIRYRPYPNDYDDTLFDLPKRMKSPADVMAAKKTLLQLKKDFNFKKIIQDLEELVLADSGKDEFNEIFKLIFAKIWDEKEALENRRDKTVEFGKVTTKRLIKGEEKLVVDADLTFDRINGLFKKACEEWPGIFRENEDIELAKRHLQFCVGPIEGVRLMGSNLRIMDDAFEYLLPTEAKKKKGQFFTPRHVVEMCVRMLNPTQKEYVMNPACGSGGFLLHAMDWCYPADDDNELLIAAEGYPSLESKLVIAEGKIESLKSDLLRTKQKLIDFDSDIEALQRQHRTEIEAITNTFDGNKRELSAHLKPIKAQNKEAEKALKNTQKEKSKYFKAEIKRLEKEIPRAEYELKLLTNRGKLELILADADLIGTLKERWIAAEVAKKLDYPIFMAVSERGGKNNSGDYAYMLNEDGHLMEDLSGQPKINQDLVNYDLTADFLIDAASIPNNQLCVAEAFVRFAQEQGLDFWRAE